MMSYKDGRTLKKYYCRDCKKEINYRNKRCPLCSGKKNSGKNHYKYNPDIHKKHHCINCSKTINYQSAIYGNGRCHSCENKFRWTNKKFKNRVSKKISYACSGKNSSGYIHGRGYEPYSSKFTQKLKEKIRKRDNYKCQNCNMKEEKNIIIYNRILEIHHIDYDKQNCDEKNLITLCKQCNMMANKNRDYWYAYFMYITNQKIK